MAEHLKIHDNLLKVAGLNHPELAFLINANGAVKLKRVRDKDLFRFLARTATGQQLSKAAAQTIWARVEGLEEERGSPIFDICTKRNENKLRNCGLSRNKVKTLLELHKSFNRGEISYDTIAKESYEEISGQISNLWGFGQWSADMVAMFFLSHPDVWPEADAALNRGMRIFIGSRRSPSKAAKLYSPYRTYLAKHIWIGLDTGIIFEL